MHILHILDHSLPLHSGYTFRTQAILEQQRLRGWTTSQLTSAKHSTPGPLQEQVGGFEFHRSRPLGKRLVKLPVYNQVAVVDHLAERLNELVPILKPDLLHAHSPALTGLAALRAGRKHGIPVVYEVRAFWEDAAVDHGTSRKNGLRYRLTRAVENYVLKRSDAITTICDGLRRDIVARGIDPVRVTVIPNSVDTERFTTGASVEPDFRAQFGLVDKTVLGFIGSFYAYEGLDVLLRAAALVAAQRPDIHVLLVGGGPEEAKLKRLAVELGISGRVVFTGRVPHQRVQRYYDLIDVLVYPRLSMRLTELVTPLKPLEAMAQGKLVLASDVGGHRELIEPGCTGELFPAGNSQMLADAVARLLSRRADWSILQNAARQRVRRDRTWESAVARYLPIYEELIQVRRSVPMEKTKRVKLTQ